LSPCSANYSATFANAASTLQAALSDLLRSPSPYATAHPRSASLLKPLPTRPRSFSLPSTPDLPAELPGSILLENQGFESFDPIESLAPIRPVSQNIRRSTHPVVKKISDEEDFSVLLSLFPEPLVHAKSVPDFLHSHSEMRSSSSGDPLSPGFVSKPSPLRVHHNKSLSGTNSRRHSRSDLALSNSSGNTKFEACSSPAGGQNSDISTITQRDASKTLQSSPLILEGQAWNKSAEHRVSRRSEVSTICFRLVVCLFVKHAALHNETVS
jgi:hypothetical protein